MTLIIKVLIAMHLLSPVIAKKIVSIVLGYYSGSQLRATIRIDLAL
jgi:hypothetical protein